MILLQLIQQNKFDELKSVLQNSDSKLKIGNVLLRILNNESLQETDYGFESYQEEFLEGFSLYKALDESLLPKNQLQEYKAALTFLAFKTGGFVKLLADRTMQSGVYLSQVESVFKVDTNLRSELQAFIDLLKQTDDLKAIANIAAAKAQITLAIGNVLKKHEIGQDMLQFASGYENAGLKEEAARIYMGILSDFECESVKLSSGLLTEITHIDTRTDEEIEIFESAQKRFEIITGKTLPPVKRVKPTDNANAEKLFDEIENREKQIKEEERNNTEDNTNVFWGKFKRLFK